MLVQPSNFACSALRERRSSTQLWVINHTHITAPLWKLCIDLSGSAPVPDATVGLLCSTRLTMIRVLALILTHTHLSHYSCPHRDPGNRHTKTNNSVSSWPLMDILTTVPLRGRWELSADENQIIQLHSQIWLISEAVAFLRAERNKKSRQLRDKSVQSTETLPSSDSVFDLRSFSRQTISGRLNSTWEISQGYKLAQILSLTLWRCHIWKGRLLVPGFFFFLSCGFPCLFSAHVHY